MIVVMRTRVALFVSIMQKWGDVDMDFKLFQSESICFRAAARKEPRFPEGEDEHEQSGKISTFVIQRS